MVILSGRPEIVNVSEETCFFFCTYLENIIGNK